MVGCKKRFSVVGLVLVFWAVSCVCQSGTLCPPVPNQPSCVCKHSGSLIDLTPLGLQANEAPRFTDIEDPEESFNTFFFNPCYTFSHEDSNCISVFICDRDSSSGGEYFFPIANGGSEKIYIDDDKTPYLFYNGYSNSVKVYLHCKRSTNTTRAVVKFLGKVEGATETYEFSLSSCHSCRGGCKAVVTAGGIGIAIIVLFFLGVLAYFMIGAVILRVRYNRSGSDMIPHKHFWRDLPFLIKDGCMLSVEPLRRKRPADYEHIK